MDLSAFTIAALPQLIFGEGRITELPEQIRRFGQTVLLVTGGRSFIEGPHWSALTTALDSAGIQWRQVKVEGEPSPQRVDEVVAEHYGAGIEVVVGIGGGSALDAAKAIAGLLPFGNSVLDHLEDVGRGIPYTGPALPFIAVPTSAGTGSEATKNAVLSEHGADGYKKSFRHDSLMARVALVDPVLLASSPRHLIAAQGMDAFTQLLESYVSARANSFTDALAWSGLEAVCGGFMAAYIGGEGYAAREGRSAMAYGALLSGITLAQVGLGSVHGLAQPLGSLFPVPHGIACGATVAEATATNINAMREREHHNPALGKYARVGRLLAGGEGMNDREAGDALVTTLRDWTQQLGIARLGDYGISTDDIPAIVAASRNNSMKSNPILLEDEEIAEIVRWCI